MRRNSTDRTTRELERRLAAGDYTALAPLAKETLRRGGAIDDLFYRLWLEHKSRDEQESLIEHLIEAARIAEVGVEFTETYAKMPAHDNWIAVDFYPNALEERTVLYRTDGEDGTDGEIVTVAKTGPDEDGVLISKWWDRVNQTFNEGPIEAILGNYGEDDLVAGTIPERARYLLDVFLYAVEMHPGPTSDWSAWLRNNVAFVVDAHEREGGITDDPHEACLAHLIVLHDSPLHHDRELRFALANSLNARVFLLREGANLQNVIWRHLTNPTSFGVPAELREQIK